jgi:hypothetical protein
MSDSTSIIEHIAPLLEKLAEKLGTTTEYLWGVLVEQGRVVAVKNIFAILWLSIPFLVIRIIYGSMHSRIEQKYNKEGYRYDEEMNNLKFGVLIASIVWGIVWIISTACLMDGIIQNLMHPEYFALDRILSIID